MRLFLSSQRLGTAPEEFAKLLWGRTRVALVPTCAYLDDPEKRRRRVAADHADLRALGLDPTGLDLRDFAGDPDRLRAELDGFDALWVLGGNAEVLRDAFHASGADDVVRDRLADDSLVYGGYSAGACVLGPGFPTWHDEVPDVARRGSRPADRDSRYRGRPLHHPPALRRQTRGRGR